MTESYWPDLATFCASWDDPAEQARFLPAVARIADALVLVSGEIQTFVAEPGAEPTADR